MADGIASQVAKEISYSVLARYFPKKYPRQNIELEVKDRVLMTKYLKSLSLTSLRFEKALNAFLDMIKAVLPKFSSGGIQDLSGIVSERLDILSEMIDNYLKNKPKDSKQGSEANQTQGSESTSMSALGPATRYSSGQNYIPGPAARPNSYAAPGLGNAADLGKVYTGSAVATETSSFAGPEKPMLDYLAASEGAGYNTQFGYQNTSGGRPITDMTIGEVMRVQRLQHGSSAIGKYQFMKGTLPEAMAGAGLTVNDKFSPENQDKMGIALLNKRGYKEWKAGKISDEDFGSRISYEWASVPNPTTGSGNYGGQNARYNTASLMKTIDTLKVKTADVSKQANNIPALFQGAVTQGQSFVNVGDNPSGREFIIPDNKMGLLANMITPMEVDKNGNATQVQPIIIYQ